MATTTELIEQNDRQTALLFLMDGIAPGFTNDARLVGYTTGAGHDVRLGLQIDGLSTKIAIDVRTGQFLDCSASVTLLDTAGDGTLAALFAAAADDARSLGDMPIGTGTPVDPLSDLTGRPELDNHNIGLERIGANGARHQYAVPPGFAIGLDHSITTPALDIEGAPVSDSPIVWLGRRWALYMVFRDHVVYPDRTVGLTAWRPMSEARILAFGTMRDQGTVNGSSITLELDGPDSLLRKPLGVGFSPEPCRAIGAVDLVTSGDDREDLISVRLSTGEGATYLEYGFDNFTTTITGTTPDEFRANVIAAIAAAAAATGIDGVWSDEVGHSVQMTEDGGVRISVAETTWGVGQLRLGLSYKVWSALGYAPAEQTALYPDDSDTRAVPFQESPLNQHPGYTFGYFYTGTAESADGGLKAYRPMYLGGTTVLLAGLNEGRGQVIRLGDSGLGGGASGTSIAHPGQLAWPVASSDAAPASPIQIDGVNCDRCGWWLFFGKRRYDGTEEVFDERWWGLANWTNGSAQQDGLVSGDSIIVTHWFDPQLAGYATKSVSKPATNWVARSDSIPAEGQIQAVPIVMLGYRSGLDRAEVVLQRLLHTTGTCLGWDSYEQDTPAIVGGDNEPAGDHTRPLDADIASLGLAIPDEWIASPDAFAVAVETIETPSILDVKSVCIAGYQAEDAIRSLMQPAGLCWHLRNGQFGIWNPSASLTLGDATVVLDRTEARVTTHSSAGSDRVMQAQRKWQPIDTWKIAMDWQPYERKVGETIERQAPDAAYRYRPGEVSQSVMAHAMRKGGSGLQERLLAQSKWAALRHYNVDGYPVDPVRPGLDCWPGTVAILTDPELWTPDGTQGVTNRIATITAVHRNWSQNDKGEIACNMTLDLLVDGRRTSTLRMEAPIAEGRGYNSATGRLYVQDDVFVVDNGWSDATAFAEPTYTGITALGGNAAVECWQWDGTTISQTFAGTVTSVSTTVGDAYLVLTSTSGTYYRDMLTWVVLRPSTTANAAWVEALHSPIANDVGTWLDDAAATQDYYPWEA